MYKVISRQLYYYVKLLISFNRIYIFSIFDIYSYSFFFSKILKIEFEKSLAGLSKYFSVIYEKGIQEMKKNIVATISEFPASMLKLLMR